MTNLPADRPLVVAASIAAAATLYTLALAVGVVPGRCAACWFPYLGVKLWAFGALLLGLTLGLLVAGLDVLAIWGSRHARR